MALGGKKESKASRLDVARERFEQAIQRLDKAIEARGDSSSQTNLDEMTSQTQALRQENEELAKKNKVVGERLDGAIKRLKTVLDSA